MPRRSTPTNRRFVRRAPGVCAYVAAGRGGLRTRRPGGGCLDVRRDVVAFAPTAEQIAAPGECPRIYHLLSAIPLDEPPRFLPFIAASPCWRTVSTGRTPGDRQRQRYAYVLRLAPPCEPFLPADRWLDTRVGCIDFLAAQVKSCNETCRGRPCLYVCLPGLSLHTAGEFISGLCVGVRLDDFAPRRSLEGGRM